MVEEQVRAPTRKQQRRAKLDEAAALAMAEMPAELAAKTNVRRIGNKLIIERKEERRA